MMSGLLSVCVFSESDTNAAFWKFNARWYGGRQLTCQLVSIPKWKSAICGTGVWLLDYY